VFCRQCVHCLSYADALYLEVVSRISRVVESRTKKNTLGLPQVGACWPSVRSAPEGGNTRANFLFGLMISQSAANLSVERHRRARAQLSKPLRTDMIR
jgi:hypothetical protein